ncbi:uncharacterized protein LOC135828134 [Sycon ciliatum]|uniref:uncharacterized protein LOC135828134 n=1 Tax=Sycon ciliatum TaxID=27933 RepID=UPI0031F6994D
MTDRSATEKMCVALLDVCFNLPLVQLLVHLPSATRNLSLSDTVIAGSQCSPQYQNSDTNYSIGNASVLLGSADNSRLLSVTCRNQELLESNQSIEGFLSPTPDSECDVSKLSCVWLATSANHDNETSESYMAHANRTGNQTTAESPIVLRCADDYALSALSVMDNGSVSFTCSSFASKNHNHTGNYTNENHSGNYTNGSTPFLCGISEPSAVIANFQILCAFMAMLSVALTIIILMMVYSSIDDANERSEHCRVRVSIKIGVFANLLLLYIMYSISASQPVFSISCFIVIVIRTYVLGAFSAWCILEGYNLHRTTMNVFTSPPRHLF